MSGVFFYYRYSKKYKMKKLDEFERMFVPQELCQRLKYLGLKIPCFRGWDENWSKTGWNLNAPSNPGAVYKTQNYTLLAPLFSQAFKWFRDEHKLHCEIFHNPTVESGNWSFSFYFTHMRGRNTNVFHNYYTYEEAELALLEKIIYIIENKN